MLLLLLLLKLVVLSFSPFVLFAALLPRTVLLLQLKPLQQQQQLSIPFS
jgi:hypothetical protein